MPTYMAGAGELYFANSGTDASSNYTTVTDNDSTATHPAWAYGFAYYGRDDSPGNRPQRVGEGPEVQHDPPRLGGEVIDWRRERREADARAEELLRLFLTEEQLAELDEHGWFTVQGRGCAYRISRGRSGNVKELDEQDRVVARWCIHPRLAVPDADTMLAQKLLIEADEQEFRETGNRSPRR